MKERAEVVGLFSNEGFITRPIGAVVHGIDGVGQVMVRRQLHRAELLKFFEE